MPTGPPPLPPRKEPKKGKSNKIPAFQSHVMENWETNVPVMRNLSLSPESEIEEKSKPTQVPTGNLIDMWREFSNVYVREGCGEFTFSKSDGVKNFLAL